MGEDDSGDKTEEPTPHKMQEARKKGQIAKSKDLTAAILLIVSFYMLKVTGLRLWELISNMSTSIFLMIPEEFTISVAGNLLKEVLFIFLMAVMPIFGVTFLVAVLMEVAQTGFLVSLDPLAPKLDKLNPLEGVKKYFSLKQYVEFVKSLIKMIIIIAIIWNVLKEEFFMVILSSQLTLWQNIYFVGELVMKVITRVGLAYFIIAIFDYMYQRFEHNKGLKMSKKEIKDEYKRLEGDPMIKQRQKDIARQMSQGRQMGAVPGADVVVTNPTHLALAISYRANDMRAPKVVAKGKRLIAQEIRKLAEENMIPVIQNPPLARALYEKADVDEEVPPEYYKAVAEILAFVYTLKKKRKHRY